MAGWTAVSRPSFRVPKFRDVRVRLPEQEASMDRALMAKRLARATLASRVDVARYLEEARISGKLREVCWPSLRRF